MTGCPVPHDTRTGNDGYCPVCGLATGPAAAASDRCAGCGAARSGGAFCEQCGHQHGTGAAPVPPRGPTRWVAVLAADRRQFDAFAGEARGFEFPRQLPERHVELCSDVVLVGHAPDGADPAPDIDLAGPPPDPGVSRQHLELLRQADGSWAARDLGSTNGTFVGRHRLAPGAVTPLSEGERIRLGLWTRITLVAD